MAASSPGARCDGRTAQTLRRRARTLAPPCSDFPDGALGQRALRYGARMVKKRHGWAKLMPLLMARARLALA